MRFTKKGGAIYLNHNFKLTQNFGTDRRLDKALIFLISYREIIFPVSSPPFGTAEVTELFCYLCWCKIVSNIYESSLIGFYLIFDFVFQLKYVVQKILSTLYLHLYKSLQLK